MHCRRHGTKPTLALWMLVAVADVALVVAAAGLLTTLLVAAALGAGAVGTVTVWRWGRSHAQTTPASPLAVRRRA